MAWTALPEVLGQIDLRNSIPGIQKFVLILKDRSSQTPIINEARKVLLKRRRDKWTLFHLYQTHYLFTSSDPPTRKRLSGVKLLNPKWIFQILRNGETG